MLGNVIVPILTSFNENGQLNLDEDYRIFLEFLVEKGVSTFMVTGTNGEFHTMNMEERKALMEFVVNNFKNKVKILAQVGTAGLRDTMILAEHAISLEVDALSVISPYFFPYDEAAIVDYFTTLANTFKETPFFIYNLPPFTKNPVTFEIIKKVKEKAVNLAGIKDTDTRPWIVQQCKKALGEDFYVYSGSDPYALAYLSNGADGFVSGTANIFPETAVSLYDSAKNSDLENASHYQHLFQEEIENVSGKTAFSASMKYALKFRGFNTGIPRKPVRDLTCEEKKEIEEYMSKAGYSI